ncbi:helix-turn-helix domain-containing protein, partial [Singulisphaera rosea]
MTTKLAPGMYFGERGRGFEVGGLTFAESAYQAGLDIPEHGHTHAFFYLVVDGACDEVCRRARRFCGTSTLVFHPAGELHANRWYEAGGRAFHVEIAS